MTEMNRMIHRRLVLKLGAASALMLGSPLALRVAWAQSEDQAGGFIRRLTDRLAAIVNGSGSQAEKKAAMKQIIDNDVDVDGVGRFCLGDRKAHV